MATWTKYAMGVVTAGIAVSGVLWYNSGGALLLGENVAALIAGANERNAFAYHLQDATLTFSSNAVSPMLRMKEPSHAGRATLYDSVLVEAREMVVRREESDGIIWLDNDSNLPAHGDMIVDISRGVYLLSETEENGVTYRVWSCTTSNYYDNVPATATVVEDSGVSYWSALPSWTPQLPVATNYPAFGALFTVSPVSYTNLYYQGGNWWTQNGLGTNVYAWDVEDTNGLASYLLKTSTLWNAKSVLNGLTRTVKVIWPADIHCTSATERAYAMTTWPDMVLTNTVVTSNTTVISSGVIVDAYARRVKSIFTDSTNETLTGYAFARDYKDCVLAYPSDTSCASGKVANISLYAVCYAPNSLLTMSFHEDTNTYDEVSYTGIAFQLDDVNAETFGLVDYLSPWPASPQPFINSATEFDDVAGDFGLPLVVNLIGTWASPSSRPTFDFGVSAFTFDDAKAGGYDGTWKNKNTDVEYSRIGRLYDGGINLYCMIVIVDWNWAYP